VASIALLLQALLLAQPQNEVEERVNYALETVGMRGYPKRSIHSLSYGEKKMICLAGVLAMKPKVMLLDEPTSNLDPMAMSDITHLLKRLNKEERITMVMATHSVDLIPIFVDRVYLEWGKVLHMVHQRKYLQIST
jgi:cobalt/nickel transport system ATP-binding protein